MDDRLRQTLTVEDYKKVFGELVADDVTGGAITLPSLWEDFLDGSRSGRRRRRLRSPD